MKIYILRSTKEPDVFGFTADITGANLPDEFGPWVQSTEGGAIETGPGTAVAGIGSSGPVLAAIKSDGFFIARNEIITRMTSKH